ncbi:CYTH-like domain-containing protein [Syncephalis fuscata]|nr:CYTH-like domain-containing protein [Syncephalis fuscata]
MSDLTLPTATSNEEDTKSNDSSSHKRSRSEVGDAADDELNATARHSSKRSLATSTSATADENQRSGTRSSTEADATVPNASAFPPPAGTHKPEAVEVKRAREQGANSALAPVLEPTLFGTRPFDDTLHAVSEFLARYITRPHLEIEAKFGLLLDKQTGQRIRLPVMSEAVISPGDNKWMRFESNMPAEWHQRINTRLNRRVEETQKPHYRGHRVNYRRARECDRFYPDGSGRVRVSVDWDTKAVLPNGILRKNRLANLHIYSPNSPFDFRLSVNEEVPVSTMPSGDWIMERKKNRVSYKHQHCQVDLTQVVTGQDTTTHELELELWDIAALQREHQRMNRHENNVFSDLVRVFLDNARTLAHLPKP